jgi:hypothetical protein
VEILNTCCKLAASRLLHGSQAAGVYRKGGRLTLKSRVKWQPAFKPPPCRSDGPCTSPSTYKVPEEILRAILIALVDSLNILWDAELSSSFDHRSSMHRSLALAHVLGEYGKNILHQKEPHILHGRTNMIQLFRARVCLLEVQDDMRVRVYEL